MSEPMFGPVFSIRRPGGFINIQWPADEPDFATVSRRLIEEIVEAHNAYEARIAELQAQLDGPR